MFQGVKYVLTENIQNLYRIYSIAKYEIIADIKDSRLGFVWNFLSPLIQVFTYWFVFGFVNNKKDVDGIDYLSWLIAGMCMWFFVNPCITKGCDAIFRKSDIITKMKFPVSILPATLVGREFFNHCCFLVIVVAVLVIKGHYPSFYWFGLLYYMFCAMIFGISITMMTSVLNMLARDVKKFISSIMRFIMYMTPILWNIGNVSAKFQRILKLNPIYYLIVGYRDCFFYHRGFLFYWKQMVLFWTVTVVFFLIGSTLMNKFRTRFIDFI